MYWPKWAHHSNMAIAMGWRKPDSVAGSSAPAIMIGSFVASGGLLFGYDTGTINGIIAMPSFIQQFTTNGKESIDPSQVAIIVSIMSLGSVLGALLSAPAGDRWGRRASLNGAVAIFSFGVIFQICAASIALLLVGRFFAGVGVGLVSVLVPLYQSEMAPKWIRGTLVCAYQLSITVGLLAASIVSIITANMEGSAAYRIPLGLQLTWACVLSLGLLILPETPRFLVKKGLREAAALSLSRLRRLDRLHPALMEELAEIEANHEYELALGADSYMDIFRGVPHLGRRTFTGCGLQILQQLTGINFIMYYSTTFFKGAGVSNPFLISLIVSIVNCFSTIPALVVIEPWGRRKLLITGSIGMGICQLLIASFTSAVGTSMPTTANQILIIFIIVDIFFFASTWGPVAWVVNSEIYPLKVRAKAMSVSTAANWCFNFGIAYGAPYLVYEGPGNADLGPKIFFVWGAFCIVAIVFVWSMVYETSKISLEQIDEMYERVAHAWNSAHFEPSWSFQQMRDLGYSDSGVQPVNADGTPANSTVPQGGAGHELQQTTTGQSGVSSGASVTLVESAPNTSSSSGKPLPNFAHVDFSY